MNNQMELQKLVMNNLIYKATYLAHFMDGRDVIRATDYVSIRSGLQAYNFNNMILTKNKTTMSQHHIENEVNYFNERRFPMNIWCWNHNELGIQLLKRIGLVEYETDYVAMVAPLHQVQPVIALPENFYIKEVRTDIDIKRFGAIQSSLYEGSEESIHIKTHYDHVAGLPLGDHPDIKLFIGIYKDEVVSIGSLMFQGETVGMYDIATLDQVRGKGLGTTMIQFLLNEAKRSNKRYCILQASPKAIKLYERVGFQSVGDLKVFENRHLIF